MLAHILLGAAIAAQAAASQPQPTTVQESSEIVVVGTKDKENKRVCKQSVATGSILPKKTCRTVAEWEERRTKDLAALEKIKEERRARDMIERRRENK